MSYLGMMSLGIFVGSIVTYAIRSIKDWTSLSTILSALFTTTFSGSVFVFIELLGGSKIGDALYMYPMGLILGMIWISIKNAEINIRDANKRAQWVGVMNIVGAVLVTLFFLALMLFQSFRNLFPALPGGK